MTAKPEVIPADPIRAITSGWPLGQDRLVALESVVVDLADWVQLD